LPIPKLKLRRFPVQLKIIPGEIIFQFFELVREDRFFENMIRELKIFVVPEFPGLQHILLKKVYATSS